jgi:hypothetical protein
VERLALDDGDVRVVDVVLEDARDLDVLLVAVGSQALVALLEVPGVDRVDIDFLLEMRVDLCVCHRCTVQAPL